MTLVKTWILQQLLNNEYFFKQFSSKTSLLLICGLCDVAKRKSCIGADINLRSPEHCKLKTNFLA